MARNTDVNNILFPVEEQTVYLQGHSKPIKGFKAIVGNLGQGFNKTFSIVSGEYKLVTNNEAIQFGKEIHLKLFPDASADSFEIFNIIVPDTKSFCQIDIIDKNYKLNIWKKEVFVPFVRIQNSYNKSRSLKFDIGFCRKLCDNGVIFEKNTTKLSFAHTRKALNNTDLLKVNVSHLSKLGDEFIRKIKRSDEIPIASKYYVPLAAKVLGRNFNLAETNTVKLNDNILRMKNFVSLIQSRTNQYLNVEKFSETAYTFFNVITDYASNNDQLPAGSINGLQTKCGMWLNQVGALVVNQQFDWNREIKEYKYLLNQQ